MTKQQKLASIRTEIAGLVAERDEIEGASIPRDEAVAMIAAVVNAPVTGTLIGPGGPNPRADLDVAPSGLLSGTFTGDGLLEMLNRPSAIRAIFPDALQAYLIGLYDAKIESLGLDLLGLPAAERSARLLDLDGEIFKLETQEEAVCEQIEADGGDVLRRGNADPRAQLGLAERGAAA